MLRRVGYRLFSVVVPAGRAVPITYHLTVHNTPEPPKIFARSHNFLLKNWWSETPFDRHTPLIIPVFSLSTGQFTGQSVQLSHQIFNQPLRRDLIHRLYHWRSMLNKYRTHLTRNITRTAGSARKPHPQKGGGRARIGKINAPGRHGGGKAHGAKPKVYSFHLNEKIKLSALRALLSSRLFQGRLRVVDTEELESGKTRVLDKCLERNLPERATVCLIVSSGRSENMERASRNIQRLKCYTSRDFDVMDLMKMDRVVITRKGLEEMTDNILKSMYLVARQPYMKDIPKPQQQQQSQQPFDPNKPLTFKFKILQDYYNLYQQTKQSKPQLVQKQLQKTILGNKKQ